MPNFAEILKKLRKSHNLTQGQLAKELNVTQTALYYWENEKREPNLEMLQKIATYFNVSQDYLLTGKEQNQKEDNTNIKKTSNLGEIRVDITPENYKKYKKEFDITFNEIVDNMVANKTEPIFDIDTGKKMSISEFKEKAKQVDDDTKVSLLQAVVSYLIINPIFNTFDICLKL